MAMWLNEPDSCSLVHRARSKFCAGAIPCHGVHLFEKKQKHRIQNWSRKSEKGAIFYTNRSIQARKIWASNAFTMNDKGGAKGYLLLVTRILSAMEILKRDLILHGGSNESERYFYSGLTRKNSNFQDPVIVVSTEQCLVQWKRTPWREKWVCCVLVFVFNLEIL